MLSAICDSLMKGQCTCIKFYCRLGTVASEMNEMLKTAFGVNAMGRMQTVEWFSRLISGETLAEVCERLVISVLATQTNTLRNSVKS